VFFQPSLLLEVVRLGTIAKMEGLVVQVAVAVEVAGLLVALETLLAHHLHREIMVVLAHS
jgi:hypothetical protein